MGKGEEKIEVKEATEWLGSKQAFSGIPGRQSTPTWMLQQPQGGRGTQGFVALLLWCCGVVALLLWRCGVVTVVLWRCCCGVVVVVWRFCCCGDAVLL